jgi:hypothetical protein
MNNIQSPRTDDAGIEAEIQAKGKTAPRVKPDAVTAAIASEHYFTAADGVIGADRETMDLHGASKGPLGLLTICVLVLRNGFTVTGESACASPANFDEGIGRRIAFENAKQKVWPLLGFVLKEQLYQASLVEEGHRAISIVRIGDDAI